MNVVNKLRRGNSFQAKLNPRRILPRREAGSVGHAEDMRIHRDCRFTESDIQDDIRGFPSDPRKFLPELRGLAEPSLHALRPAPSTEQ